MKRNIFAGLIAAITLASGVASLQAATLNIGDPAPKIQVSKWIQGDAVTEFKPGTVYIVEFWATWCPPCRASIPHLNQTYLKFKDKGVVVIGVDVRERNKMSVEPFVKKMGTNMTYRVATDYTPEGSKGKMLEAWMMASDSHGIPTAFVIGKDNRIAWIGHPMKLNDSIIEKVLDGTFDVKAAAAERAKEKKE